MTLFFFFFFLQCWPQARIAVLDKVGKKSLFTLRLVPDLVFYKLFFHSSTLLYLLQHLFSIIFRFLFWTYNVFPVCSTAGGGAH